MAAQPLSPPAGDAPPLPVPAPAPVPVPPTRDPRLAALIQHAPDIIVVIAPDGILSFASPSLERITGHPPETSVGTTFHDVIHPDDLPGVLEIFESVLATPRMTRASGTFRLMRTDGEIRWLEAVATNLLDDPVIHGIVVNARDVTERKRMEEALSASERRWRLLFEQSPLSIQILSPDGHTRQANDAWSRMFGLTLDEVRDFSLLDDPQLRASGQLAVIQRAFLGEVVRVPAAPFEPRLSPHIHFRHAPDPEDGPQWIGGLMFPVHDDHGRIEEVVCIHENVTERARALEKIKRSEAVTRTINDFATSLSSLHTEDDILWDITRRCIATLGFEDCVIYLLDESRGVLVQKAAFGPKNPADRIIAAPIELPVGRGIVGAVAASGRFELIPDTRTDPRYIVDDAVRRSEIAVPIIAEGRVLGVIDSENSRPGFFNQEHLTVLGAIASVCANKLIRARAEQQLRDLNRDLERRIAERTTELVNANEQLKREIAERARAEKIQRALFEISEAAHAAEDLPRLYGRIHEIIGTLMPARNFYIALFDAPSNIVSFPYHRDAMDPPPSPRPARRGMTEYVLRTGRAALADLHEIQRLKETGEYVQSGHPAAIWLGVPLTVGGRTFGVMAVQDHQDPRAFGEEEKRILSFVAGQTALTIERKRAEAELRAGTDRLRESEERFSKAFRAIPANVSLVRAADERIIEVNEAFLENAGFRRHEVIGKSTAELGLWIDPSQRTEFFRRLHDDGCVRSFETTLRTRNGRDEIMLISAELLEIDGEPVILALALVVTERKRAEAELLRSLARERELSRLKGAFVSLVSHEFRTPLGVIHSSAEILERYLERLPPPERLDHVRAIQSHAWRMATLMEDVLVFGRVEAGKLEFRPIHFDLREVCRRWTDELARATERRCPIQLDFGNAPETASGDPDLLRHILTNLLSNAVKYSPAGQSVELTAARHGRFAVFRVSDRGLGIPAADRERLFTAFQRGTNVRHLPGTGLGLAVIKHCLDLHQGTISVTSEEMVGTEVIVHVPLYPD